MADRSAPGADFSRLDSLGQRIRYARQQRQLSQASVAEAFDITRNAVSLWENDSTAPESEKLPRLARLLEVDLGWLMEAAGAPPDEVREAPARGRRRPMIPRSQLVGERDLPIYAAAMGGSGHLIISFDPVDWTRRPAALEHVRDGYGILVVGDSMVPAYQPGDIALVHPLLAPAAETDVVLYRVPPIEEAEAMIKRLVTWTERSWKLRQYHPPREFQEPKSAWHVCHRVVGRYNSR